MSVAVCPAPSGLISVTDEHGGGLYVLDPARGDVERLDSSRQPGGVAPVGDLAVSVDVTGQGVRVFDVVELRQVAKKELGTRLTHAVALDGDRVAIADTDGDRLIVVSVTPQIGDVELEVDGEPHGLAFDEARSRLYVTLTDRNEMLVHDTDRPGEAQGALQLLRPADLPAG